MSTVAKKEYEALMARSSSEIREDAKVKAAKFKDIWFDLGMILFRIRSAQEYEKWKFASFEEYLDKELGLEYRGVAYCIQIIDKMIFKLGVDEEKVKKIPWTKVRAILPVSTSKKSAEEWLDKAETKNYDQLTHAVKNKIEGKTEDAGPVFEPLNVTVTAEEKKTIFSAMEIAKKMSQNGNDRPGHLLEMIAFHFVGNHPSNRREAFAEMVSKLEQVFHVKLLAVDKENPKWKDLFEQARDVIRSAQVEA